LDRIPLGILNSGEKDLDMATLQELLVQKEALDRQIEQTKSSERGEAVDKVRSLMAEYGLTVADLGPRMGKSATRKSKQGGGGKVAAKYRNASTGESWSGRGLQPRWLKAAIASGRKIGDFAV
jgi:DNA-binding protein H-NS